MPARPYNSRGFAPTAAGFTMKLSHFVIGVVCFGLFVGLFSSVHRTQSFAPQLAQLAEVPTDTATLNGIAFSPDGRTLAACGTSGGAVLIDAANFRPLPFTDSHFRCVNAAAFTPDGKTLARAGLPFALLAPGLLFRDQATGVDRPFPPNENLIGAWSLSFSPDGKNVAICGLNGVLEIRRVSSGERVADLKGHAGRVRHVAFSRDGRALVSAGDDQAVKVWDAETWAERVALRGHVGDIRSAAVSSDGNRVVTAGADCTVRLWDAVSGAQLRSWRVGTDRAYAAVFSPSGRTVAAAGWSSPHHDIFLFDAATGRMVSTNSSYTDAYHLAFSPDGRTLAASANTSIRFFSVPAGR